MKKQPKIIKCKHRSGKLFKCNTIRIQDAVTFANEFYKSQNKILQDCFLLKYCSAYEPHRRSNNGGPKKSFRIDYYIRKRDGKTERVCKKFFLNIVHISEFRVKKICKNHLETGSSPVETRGGDRKSMNYNGKRNAVINFIESFKVLEVHYCRSKTRTRQYLPKELNINRMFKMYAARLSESPELTVKTSFFRKVFNRNFNIGFKTPATDKCSTCISFKERIKILKDIQLKNKLMVAYRVHKLRGQAFFDLLKREEEGIITMSFDCQKNLPLPKIPDQATYYSRQLYLYNFAVVQGSSKSSLTTNNVFFYNWMETDRPKGSNEIASAIFHRLKNTDLTNSKKIRLFCDGCGGQNKNSIMVGMCASWLATHAPRNIKEIELIYPVVGHSYIPPDRVFAQIEKKVREKEEIIHPDEYREIFKDFGTLIQLGADDCPVHDWKAEATATLKAPSAMHFKFNECKRFILRRSVFNNVHIRGEVSYKSDTGTSRSFVKRGKLIQNMQPLILDNNNGVKSEKLSDVEKLLKKHFGPAWQVEQTGKSAEFYKQLLRTGANEAAENEDGLICEYRECEQGFSI